jgi:Zn-dependent protease with chaperone function
MVSLIFGLIGLAPLVLGILPPAAIVLAAGLAVAAVVRTRITLARSYPGLRRYTVRAAAAYPEEFAAVASLAEELTGRFGLPRRIELLACSNEGLGMYALGDRTLVVTAGELSSLATGGHPRLCGEATIAHELGHLADRRSQVRQHLVYGLRYLALFSLALALIAMILDGRGPLASGAVAVILVGLVFVGTALVHLFDSAREFEADRYAARRLGNITAVTRGLALEEVLNVSAHLHLDLTFAGARDVLASLRSLEDAWPLVQKPGHDLRLRGMIVQVEAGLRAGQARGFWARLSYWLDRGWLTYRSGGIARHPLMGERIRALLG